MQFRLARVVIFRSQPFPRVTTRNILKCANNNTWTQKKMRTKTTLLLSLLEGIVLSSKDDALNKMQKKRQPTTDDSTKDSCIKLKVNSIKLKVAAKGGKRSSDCDNALVDEVEKLVVAHPKMVSIANFANSFLPLHYAALIGNLDLTRLIMEKFPAAISTANAMKETPLHYAAKEGYTDIVALFLESSPESTQIKSHQNELPLHLAAAEGHREVVKQLLRVYPQGASRRCAEGKIPLHYAAHWGKLKLVSDLLVACPDGIQMLDWEGSLPLHEAAKGEGDIETFKLLLERFPEGINRRNIRGETPLFSAVRSDNVNLVTLCLKAWPHGGQHILKEVIADDRVDDWNPKILELCLTSAVGHHLTKGKKGLPLPSFENEIDSYTAAGRCEDEFTLSTVHPSSSESFDTKKRTSSYINPHQQSAGNKKRRRGEQEKLGVGRGMKKDSQLSDKSEEENKLQSVKKSYLPLHSALACGAAPAILECILQKCSSYDLSRQDKYGQLPLHLAVANYCREEGDIEILIQKILKPCPEASMVKDAHGRLPLHVALIAEADVRVLFALLDANPAFFVKNI